jgi:hypothetical protein
MSMIGNFVSLQEEQLQALIEDPGSVEAFLHPEDSDDDEPANHLDVDKAWQGIHFLLTGEAWGGTPPLSMAVLGGTEFGGDVGYGPAHYLTSSQVLEVAQAFMKVSRSELTKRFSPAAMSEAAIYPEIWDEGEEALDYLLGYYDSLVLFYQEAASRGDAVLQYIS